METVSRIRSLLRALNICRGDVVFLHTSFKRMSFLGLTPLQLLESLVEQLGPNGTLAVPRYSWNVDRSQPLWKAYEIYYDTRPDFDVIRTPANIGLVPETFRFFPGVKNSLSYFFSLSVLGPLATEITKDQERVSHFWGDDSSFNLLRLHGVKIVGMGVSLNTTSLSLLVDFRLGGGHPHSVFTDRLQTGTVIDRNGKRIETRVIWLLPEAVRVMHPGKVMEASDRMKACVRRADEGSTINFAYPYQIFYEEALTLGLNAARLGTAVPWFTDYPLKKSGT